jgi:hypothetical protein
MATLEYEIWKADASREDAQGNAATLYHGLYEKSPTLEYAHRLSELTGEDLPNTDSVPEPPPVVTEWKASIEEILDHIDVLLTTLPSPL